MIYVAITAALFLLRHALAGQVRLSRQIYPLLLVALFLFSGFRHEVGCDWSGYYFQFLAARDLGPAQALGRQEAVWWLILIAQHEWALPYPWINVISSAICFAGIHVLARRQPDPLGFLVLLFPVLIINMPMSGIRQGAAIGLICIAMARFLDGRAIAFAFWVALATGFHSSAAVFLLFVPLVSRRITPARLVLAALLAIPGAYLLISGEAGQVATERYIETDLDAAGAVFRVLLLILSGLFYLMFLRRAWRDSSPRDYQIINVGVFGMLATAVFLPVSTVIADRLNYYLMPAQAMVFARIPWLSGLRNRGWLAALPYLGLLVFFTGWSLTSRHFQQCYLPYQSWLFG